jgi:hypothetical protein
MARVKARARAMEKATATAWAMHGLRASAKTTATVMARPTKKERGHGKGQG